MSGSGQLRQAVSLLQMTYGSERITDNVIEEPFRAQELQKLAHYPRASFDSRRLS